jgi:hypothetical protein
MRALIVVLASLLSGAASAEQPKQEAWVVACTLSGYDCESLPRPEVRRMTGPLLGAYTLGGPAVVKVNRRVRYGSSHYRMILAHEYTHYLQDVTGNHMTVCEMETEAWSVGNTYAQMLRSPHLVDITWASRYNHCN